MRPAAGRSAPRWARATAWRSRRPRAPRFRLPRPLRWLRLAPRAARTGAPAVAFAYDAIEHHRFGGQVVLATGAPAGLARVHVVARPLSRVGLLTVGTGAPVPIGGHFRRDLSTDSTGRLSPVDLPAAVYDVLVEPSSTTGLARTRFVMDLSVADHATERFTLAARVTLRGRVATGDGSALPLAGARVTAVERGATAVFGGTTDADGQFSFAVDPGASYDLSATPALPTSPQGAPWARARLPVEVGSADLTLPDLTAPPGVHVSGWVTDGSGKLLAGSLVEAFVGPCASGQPAAGD